MNKKRFGLHWLAACGLLVYGASSLAATAAEKESPKAAAAASSTPSPARPAEKSAAPEEARGTPVWQAVFVEPGRRVEIDNASIKKGTGNRVNAYGRIVFEKPLPDAVSGGTYQILESLNAYDCDKRTFVTQRRIYRKDEKNVLRDETSTSKADLPVRTGTLDEKLLRAACRPGGGDSKANFAATVKDAKAAAGAPAADPRKELLRTEFGGKTQKSGAPAIPATKVAGAKTAAHKAKPSSSPVAESHSFDHVHWAYEGRGGPENWGKLSPDNKLCDSGTRQSPIDIRDGIRVDQPPISFAYRPSLFRIIDNGHTIQAGVSENRISLLGKEYDLIQLHFHRPSEERVNGRSFDMVAHLVHKSYDGQLAVLAILIERGNEHPLIQTLWNYLPLERNVDVLPPGVPIDLNQLLPEKREYFTYMGSLTTPPCTEGVLWLVMQTPIQLSPEQIGIFSRLYPSNARPIQPQNGRLIKESR